MPGMSFLGIQIRHRMSPSHITIDPVSGNTDDCVVTCDRHGHVGRFDNSPTAQRAAIRHAQNHRNNCNIDNNVDRG